MPGMPLRRTGASEAVGVAGVIAETFRIEQVMTGLWVRVVGKVIDVG